MTKIENTSAGVFFYAQSTNRFLFLLRNDEKNPGFWGIPGGKIEKDESLLEGVKRECEEEIGFYPQVKLIPIQKFVNNTFTYHTFFGMVSDEFMPTLNDEHSGYCWVPYDLYPRPLHPGLFNTINFDVVKDKLDKLIKKAA